MHRRSPVGVSLLAIASAHSTSSTADPPPSRAGSLLQGCRVFTTSRFTANPCGSELAREGVRSGNISVECAGLFVSKLTPTGPSVFTTSRFTADPCGSELAREGVRSGNISAEGAGLFVSKLTPTGPSVFTTSRFTTNPCGSEPARESAGSGNEQVIEWTPSRAGSLPQGAVLQA